MSAKDGRKVKTGDRPTRKSRKAYTKCIKHASCRQNPDSIWRKS